MSEKIAFLCNAGCQKRYGSSDSEIDSVKDTLSSKGYDVRTRGCLQICSDIESFGFPRSEEDIVNVELHLADGAIKRSVAGNNGDNIGIRTVVTK